MALFFVMLVVWGPWEAGDYFRRNYPDLPDRGYPVASVVGSCALLFAEAFVLWRVLAGSLSIGRALAASGLSIGAAGILFFTLMMPDHIPARVTYHFLWLLSAAAISMGTFLTLAASHVARLLVGRRQSSG
jgi:multisubunit Na+/H+ antiporter MnhE subunit